MAVGALAVVVALVAVLGGWAPSTAQAARDQQPGVAMKVPGWTITVHRAEVVNHDGADDDYPDEKSEVRLFLDLTSTDEESESFFPGGLVQVQLPDGTPLPDGYAEQTAPWSGSWDPDVTFPSAIDTELPGLALDAPAPSSVVVVVHDRVPARGFLRTPGELSNGPARWRLELPTPDLRRPVEE
ncbi:hypothetical protein SAMN04489747_2402 [Auraticoccus monumenti]|uniref:DUF4352 domain-containing protein n=2 Tax=Auraticoccus monumenti TaxID=675864 RepID=A0A1G6ZU85_9ACTN|nr:hypothetical protein SAMN04489747_2402 [Auraticoccus monumenti]